MSAAQMVAVWAEVGLAASHMKSKADGEVAYTLCQGDVCERKTTAVSANANGSLSLKLLGRLYFQPIALLAVGGMLLLSLCLCVENSVTDQILALAGGREVGMYILVAAVVAHLLEGCFALYICTQKLRFSATVSLHWCTHVIVCGYPILQWVLKLQKHAELKA